MRLLYLCEKPKQAADIAVHLGLSRQNYRKFHYQSKCGNVTVTHAVGHLFETWAPEKYDDKYKVWRLDTLPIKPSKIEIELKAEHKSLFSTIKKLLSTTDKVIVATDPDEEGSVIAADILEKAQFKGEVDRAIFSSTDKAALNKAFSNTTPFSELYWMVKQGRARRDLDWLIGMNATRIITDLAKKKKKIVTKKAFSMGRVVTPTCLLVLSRKLQRDNFKPVKHFSLWAELSNGESVKIDIPKGKFTDTEGRLVELSYASRLRDAILGKTVTLKSFTEDSKRELAPLPHDLTSLKLEVEKYKISSEECLQLLQSIYDSPLSLVTYPRTGIRYLPEGQRSDVPRIASAATSLSCFKGYEFDFGKEARAYNDSKVDVHHGIIPTTVRAKLERLTKKQTIIYLEITKRFLQQFMKDFEYVHYKSVYVLNELELHSSTKVPTCMGWKGLEDHNLNRESEYKKPTLNLTLVPGDKAKIVSVDIRETVTKKPPLYTTAKLENDMKDIANAIEEPKFAKILKDSNGIGTEATRSGIIKKALDCGLLKRNKMNVDVTPLFVSMTPYFEQLFSPILSAKMQDEFLELRNGNITYPEFVNKQFNVITSLLERVAK